MIWPPSIARLRIEQMGKKRFNLWLPIILLWPIILCFLIFLLPLLFFYFLLRLQMRAFWRFQEVVKEICLLFCSLRGLQVRIQEKNFRLLLLFY